MHKCRTVLIYRFYMSGKAIFKLIAMEGAYVQDLQLVVEVCEHFLFIIDDLMVPSVFVNIDILLEHVEALGSQDDFYHICKCRGYPLYPKRRGSRQTSPVIG